MTSEEVIVKTIPVNRIGAIIQFQVPLPADTKKIIGIEHGITGFNGTDLLQARAFFGFSVDASFKMYANRLIGRLSLQTAGSVNQFYQSDLLECKNHWINEGIASTLWQPQPWTHNRKREEITLAVPANDMVVEGFFKDSYGAGKYESLTYNLHLYLWIEKCLA